MGRINRSASNILAGISFKALRTIMPFIIRTIIIYRLGVDYAGLDSLFVSLLQTLSLMDLGFGMALTYSMYKPIAMGDDEKLSALMAYFKVVYRNVGIVIMVIGICIMPTLRYIIKGDCPNDINLYVLYLIYLTNTCLSYFLYANSQALLVANQRSDILNGINFVINICIYILQIVLLFVFKNYYLYALLIVLGTFCVNIAAKKFSEKKCPYKHFTSPLSREEKKEIIGTVKSLIGHKLGGVVLNSTDNIIVSVLFGLAFVTIYSNYYYVINAVSVMLIVCFEAITASVGNSIVLETRDKNYKDFLILSDISDWIIGLCCTCIIGAYQCFMTLWVGNDLLFPQHTMILFVIYFYFNMIRRMTLTYKDAAGMWWADFWKPYVGAVCNLIFSILLSKLIGIDGVVLGSIISMALVSLPWGAFALHKHYFNKSLGRYYIKLIYHTVLTFISCFVCYKFITIFSANTIYALLLKLVFGIICGNVVFAIGYFASREHRNVFSYIKRIISIFLKREDVND